jgi:hypothetical protein
MLMVKNKASSLFFTISILSKSAPPQRVIASGGDLMSETISNHRSEAIPSRRPREQKPSPFALLTFSTKAPSATGWGLLRFGGKFSFHSNFPPSLAMTRWGGVFCVK